MAENLITRLVVDPAKATSLPELPDTRSRFAAPPTVRVSVSRPANGNSLHLHLVNYNRTEPKEPRSPGAGIHEERPIATPKIAGDVLLPKDVGAVEAKLFTPEIAEPIAIPVTITDGRAKFEIPSVLVYGVIELAPKE